MPPATPPQVRLVCQLRLAKACQPTNTMWPGVQPLDRAMLLLPSLCMQHHSGSGSKRLQCSSLVCTQVLRGSSSSLSSGQRTSM
jgi:hypothetical protein